ncbi:MAG: hypothetical protein CL678_02640 [Bdellovibrionaceae bacterium]|nr:hypothetical protein [Pseudobdellovibrionaceae bacterium]|tara:strand:- start:2813 stop:4273 length:1461 start_codon:yes stop_codon:yes gene_type:complete
MKINYWGLLLILYSIQGFAGSQADGSYTFACTQDQSSGGSKTVTGQFATPDQPLQTKSCSIGKKPCDGAPDKALVPIVTNDLKWSIFQEMTEYATLEKIDDLYTFCLPSFDENIEQLQINLNITLEKTQGSQLFKKLKTLSSCDPLRFQHYKFGSSLGFDMKSGKRLKAVKMKIGETQGNNGQIRYQGALERATLRGAWVETVLHKLQEVIQEIEEFKGLKSVHGACAETKIELNKIDNQSSSVTGNLPLGLCSLDIDWNGVCLHNKMEGLTEEQKVSLALHKQAACHIQKAFLGIEVGYVKLAECEVKARANDLFMAHLTEATGNESQGLLVNLEKTEGIFFAFRSTKGVDPRNTRAYFGDAKAKEINDACDSRAYSSNTRKANKKSDSYKKRRMIENRINSYMTYPENLSGHENFQMSRQANKGKNKKRSCMRKVIQREHSTRFIQAVAMILQEEMGLLKTNADFINYSARNPVDRVPTGDENE